MSLYDRDYMRDEGSRRGRWSTTKNAMSVGILGLAGLAALVLLVRGLGLQNRNYELYGPRQSTDLFILAVLAVTVYCSWRGFNQMEFFESAIFSSQRVLGNGEYWRLVTSGLVHADWIHLFFNMYTLYSFGRSIEVVFGIIPFALIYFAGIIGGNLLSLLLHRYENYRAVGASGGVCGVIFASIFLMPGGGIEIFPIPIAIPAYLYAIFFVIGSAIGVRGQLGNIGHDAHLGGALIGLVAATGLYPGIIDSSPVLYTIVVGLSVGLLLWLYWRTRPVNPRPVAGPDPQAIDRLLEKISKSGIDSLSASEKKQLDEFAKRRRTGG